MSTPAQTTFVSASTSYGALDSYIPVGGTGTVLVDLGSMAPNATATVTVVVKVRIRSTGSIVGQAIASSGSIDPVTANSTALRTVPIS